MTASDTRIAALESLAMAGSLLATAEALAVAARSGLEPAVFVDVLNESSGGSHVSRHHLPDEVLSGRYGLSAEEHRLRISAVRCADFPDPVSDRGVSRFVYRLVPHKGDWRSTEIPRRARALQQPMLARAFQPHQGRLPKEHSWYRLDGPQCVLTCLKRSEDGDGLVARFFEASGKASSFEFDFCGREHDVVETNFIEDSSDSPKRCARWKDQLGPYQIKTLKLST